MARASRVPHHTDAFVTPEDFSMSSWREHRAFTDDAVTLFPELARCREASHSVDSFRLNLPTGMIRTVGCVKCRTGVYRGRLVPLSEIFRAGTVTAG